MAQNAIELLKADHVHVRELLGKLAETTSRAVKSRTDLLEKIETELKIHTRLEEDLLSRLSGK